MLEQVLNRHFVLSYLEEVLGYLESVAADDEERRSFAETRRGLGGEEISHDLSLAESRALLEYVKEAQFNEAQASSGQKTFIADSERRSDASTSLDDTSFISRSPIISLLQTAIEEYYTNQRSDTIEETPVEAAGRRGGGALASAVTNCRIKDLPEVRASGGINSERRFATQFEVTDIRWVSSGLSWLITKFRGKHDFNNKPATDAPRRVEDDVRLVVVGDWATGLPRAQNVANEMRKVLDEGIAANRQQLVIHLGDTYYSGWKPEYEKRLLKYWPVRPEEADRIGSFTLNGNHDMYSGGHSYYTVGLGDARFKPWHNGSSFFSLANKNWHIFGLDTAYDDFDLKDPQADWVNREISRHDKNLMLLSHHQLFSAYEGGGPKLAEKLGKILESKRVRSWYWGHEHRCMFYP
jgi:Calcineurin-like phosphoesterase